MIKLHPVLVEKPWGVTQLPDPFEMPVRKHIGEIWFQGAEQEPRRSLLVKYLFTSQALSIQVHPNDEQARARGLLAGKEECWYILDAKPGASMGIGTTRPLDAEELQAAARTGEIEDLLQWHPVEPGMLFHIPPGTIHAIGAGITLLEVQQNNDITYRLYDYGRPRELHLADGSDVAEARPFPSEQQKHVDPEISSILLRAKHFTVAQITDDRRHIDINAPHDIVVIPLTGTIQVADITAMPGECLIVSRETPLTPNPGARALLAWTD